MSEPPQSTAAVVVALAERLIPLLVRRGGRDKRKWREASLEERPGWSH